MYHSAPFTYASPETNNPQLTRENLNKVNRFGNCSYSEIQLPKSSVIKPKPHRSDQEIDGPSLFHDPKCASPTNKPNLTRENLSKVNTFGNCSYSEIRPCGNSVIKPKTHRSNQDIYSSGLFNPPKCASPVSCRSNLDLKRSLNNNPLRFEDLRYDKKMFLHPVQQQPRLNNDRAGKYLKKCVIKAFI